MSYLYRLLSAVLLATVTACAQSEHADHEFTGASLDAENSLVSFISIKNKDVAEVHTFDAVSGTISGNGGVQVSIDASSLNTGIGIRDERMKEHLFAVLNYPNISISAQIDIDSLSHGAQRVQLPASLSLLGKQYDIELDVLVTRHKTEITASTARPVLINAAQVGLTEGVAKLAELAGGISIGSAVPVNFALSFKQ